MDSNALLRSLGYDCSSTCLRGKELEHAPEYGHVFRRAKGRAGLEAVYCLRPPKSGRRDDASSSLTPISYVCKAASFEEAERLHRLVWNQNVVPFVIVLAPDGVRVYTGFDRPSKKTAGRDAGYIIKSNLDEVASKLAALSAQSIDSGAVWDRLGRHVRPDKRVQWRLLSDLAKLEKWLIEQGLTDPAAIHALVGKFVYLYYLRHRDILSDARLSRWGLAWEQAAGRSAQLSSFGTLCDRLEEWLNGAVFPISQRMLRDIGAQRLQRVAAVFAGDEPGGQMHLSFDDYDFSFIPIETLSIIYEQFLHLKSTPRGSTARKERAAYYTPIPVVNFMIDRMDELKPLKPGTRILDFACGSGAFLVQCYRRLVEDTWRSAPGAAKPRASELRDLLVKHVFGMDVDDDACRVAELSLLLTLLDYVEPPDLLTRNGHDRFKLPTLADTNIVRANAFDEQHAFVRNASTAGYDWIIGNPPWKEIKNNTPDPVDRVVLDWMRVHKKPSPTGGNQAAEAFAWRAQQFARPGAIAGLLMPATTLFKTESKNFRQVFFASNPLAYVANFSNLAEVLFSKRSREPAAALVFRPSGPAIERVPVFSPLVANQEPTRPRVVGERIDTWTIAADQDEVRSLEHRSFLSGQMLPWKLAAWGSEIDRRLLRRLDGLDKLGPWAKKTGLAVSEGLQLRGPPAKCGEAVEHHPELAGRLMLLTGALKGSDRAFVFLDEATREVRDSECYVRKGRSELPESVCRPPHVIVSAACNWAVFEDRYLIVPPRQIGIAGRPQQADLLKALALYFNSDFFQYHQFFFSTQLGVQRKRSTLRALRAAPIPRPLLGRDGTTIEDWAKLYEKLALHECSSSPASDKDDCKEALLRELNQSVNRALGLHQTEAVRVSDFVHVILGLRDGKVEERAVRAPTPDECRMYASTLKRELDAFVEGTSDAAHAVQVWTDEKQGAIQIDLSPDHPAVVVHPRLQGEDVLSHVTEIRRQLQKHLAQWHYFNRNLRIFAPGENRLYLFKPMQRFHWLESQAVLDAGEVIGLVLDHQRVAR